jgi:hypothetical protein
MEKAHESEFHSGNSQVLCRIQGLRAGCVPMEVKFYTLKNIMAFFFKLLFLGVTFGHVTSVTGQ